MNAIAVVDIDGVLADVAHRLHHVVNLDEGRRPNWDAFFAAAHLDEPIEVGICLVRALASQYRIHLLSGRAERIRAKTIGWLAEHGVDYEALWLRRESDHRPDYIFKGEALDRLGLDAEVALVVDDSERIVEMASQRGIIALHFRVPGVGRDRSITAWKAGIGPAMGDAERRPRKRR